MFAEKVSLEELGNWTRIQTLPLKSFTGCCWEMKKAAKGQNDVLSKAIHNMSIDDIDDLDDFKL